MVIESPPRFTGDPAADQVILAEYVASLFRNIQIDSGATPASIGPLGRGHIDGLTLTYSSGGLISIGRGVARAEDDSSDIRLNNALFEKTLAPFAQGSNKGMLDDGVRAANTWYHVFAVANPTTGTVDAIASKSLTNPVIPQGFSTKRRILSILTLPTGPIRAFRQIGDHVWWDSPGFEVNDPSVNTASFEFYPVPVPPGIETLAFFNAQLLGAAVNAEVYIAHPSVAQLQPSTSAAPLNTLRRNANYAHGGQVQCPTDTLGRIAARARVAGTELLMSTLGWVDPRGRNAA
jgi:hypothetical protein